MIASFWTALGAIAAIIAAVAWLGVAVLLGYNLALLTSVVSETARLVHGITEETVPLLSEVKTTVSNVNREMDRVDVMLESTGKIVKNVERLSTVVEHTVSSPLIKVAAGNVETSQRIVDVLLGAFAQALPDLVPAASQGTMNNVLIGGEDPRTGAPFTYYETLGGGQGARPGRDGMSGVHTHMTNTLNTPVEALETAYPLRILEYRLRDGTGETGRWRGGDGLRRTYQILAARATVSLLTERRRRGPWGLGGGSPGAPGRNALIRDGVERELGGKETTEVRRDDRLVIDTPGGGGVGAPEGPVDQP